MKPTFKFILFFILLNFIGLRPIFSQAPVINIIQGSVVLCLPGTSPISYTASASNSPTSYTWNISGTGNVILSNASSSICTLNFSFPYTKNSYTLQCQASNGSGSSNTASFVVNVFETPTVTFSGSNNFCQGSGTNISASSTMFQASSTTISYNWAPSTGLSSTTSPNVFANPPSTTNYTVLLTSGACTNTAFFSLTVHPLPILSASLTSSAICQGQSSNLILSGNASSYFLNTNPVSNPTALSPAVTTPYIITGKNSFGCTSLPVFLTLTVNPLPVISGGFNPPGICPGQSSTLTLGGTATSYSINSVSGSSLIANPAVSTVYTASGINNFGCQSPPQQIGLTVNPLPLINISSSANVICKGESVSLGFSGSAVSYSINGTLSPAIATITPTVSTSYTISGVSASNCTNSITQAILVNPCVGLSEFTKITSGVTLFPNPSENGTIMIYSVKSQPASIVNELGQVIKSFHIEAGTNTEVSGLSSGIYFIISPDSKKKIVVTR